MGLRQFYSCEVRAVMFAKLVSLGFKGYEKSQPIIIT